VTGTGVLVTGGAGFAGSHLLEALGEGAAAPDRDELELLDPDAVRAAVAAAAPGRVFHLAALASVTHSWSDPRETLADNVQMTLNVLEAVRHEAPGATVLLAGSGEVYGPPERLPIDESAPLRPQNPYAVSKATCDLLGGLYADAHGLRVIRTRSFNHAGPRQTEDYLVGTLTRQVADAEAAGADEVVLRTGNPDSARDFTDVRDVVRAYVALPEADPGVYNISSGTSTSVRELIDLVRAATALPVRHEVDPARVRAHDVPNIVGDSSRLRAATGWAPEIPLARTVADALNAWRERLEAVR